MRIAIPAVGTKSDLFSYLALAVGLQRAGHRVVVGSHPLMAEMVQSYDLPFHPIGPNVDVGRDLTRIRETSGSWLAAHLAATRRLITAMEQASPDVLELCRQADLVIVPHTFAGRAEVDILNKPFVTVTMQEQLIPAFNPEHGDLERFADRLGAAAINRLVAEPHNRLRRKLNLPPLKGGVDSLLSARLNLVPISSILVPPNPNWESQHRVVGYWHLAEPFEWSPPSELQVFLLANDPVIAISLGPLFKNSPQGLKTARLVIEAARQAGVFAVVQGWEDIFDQLDLPETMLAVTGVPNNWLLPRVRMVLHNGGFGSTAAGLRAGIPAVVMPHRTDSPVWAQRLADVGVAPDPIPVNRRTPDALAEAIITALRSGEMHQRAALLGEQVRLEAGVRRAVQLIEEVMS